MAIPHEAFYGTTAQVLPLFGLALIAEQRIGITDRSRRPYTDAVLAIGTLSSIALGEIACFRALAGHAGASTLTTAETGIGVAGILLFADLVMGQVFSYLKRKPGGWQSWAVPIVGLCVVVGASVYVITGR